MRRSWRSDSSGAPNLRLPSSAAINGQISSFLRFLCLSSACRRFTNSSTVSLKYAVTSATTRRAVASGSPVEAATWRTRSCASWSFMAVGSTVSLIARPSARFLPRIGQEWRHYPLEPPVYLSRPARTREWPIHTAFGVWMGHSRATSGSARYMRVGRHLWAGSGSGRPALAPRFGVVLYGLERQEQGRRYSRFSRSGPLSRPLREAPA